MGDHDGSGLTFQREGGFFSNTYVALVTDVPGIPITVRRRHRYSVLLRHYYITIDLTFRLPAPCPRFSLLREGTFRSWIRRFGYQDIQTGHADFDFRFIVKGEEEAAVRAFLVPVAEPLLDAVDHLSSVACDGRTVVMTAVWHNTPEFPATSLARLVDAMRALALGASSSER